jgi:hypothetical protein
MGVSMTLSRVVSGGLAAITLAAGLAATAPAQARDRLSPGAAAALGVVGGLALGAGIAAAAAPPAYAAPVPVYRAPPPPPVYVERAPRRVYYAPPRRVVVEEHCWVERTRQWVPGWGWEHERRTVCR